MDKPLLAFHHDWFGRRDHGDRGHHALSLQLARENGRSGDQTLKSNDHSAEPRSWLGRTPVTLEEFGDFQCPPCGTMATVIDSIAEEYSDRLRFIFWQFPLPVHEQGRHAALAAEAASRQGYFWEMHHLLYADQIWWSPLPDARAEFEGFAEELHLNAEQFRKDLESAEVAARVDAEHEYGISRGVKNTPTLFVNGVEVPPPFTPKSLHEAIEKALGQPRMP